MMIVLSGVAVAKAKVAVSSVLLVVFGVLFLPGLVVGDAQWQAYTNKGKCDSTHIIYTMAPKMNDGVLGKIQFAVPCNEWFALNN